MEENEKKLYPVSFEPVKADTAWGSETFSIADLGYVDTAAQGGWLDGNALSDIMETYLERVVGDKVYYFYGRQFPVTVKMIETKTDTPVWVCPDDDTAEQRYDSLGKKKLWYVLGVQPGAKLYIGFGKEVTAAGLYEGVADGGIESYLNAIEVHKGDSFVIDPATAHAIGGGIRLVEISEASGLDFEISNRGNECDDLVSVLDFINMNEYEARPALPQADGSHPEDRLMRKLAAEPEFTVTEIRLTDALNIRTSEFESFLIYTCLEGEASVQVPAERENGEKYMENFIVGKGQTMLVPNEVEEFYLTPRAEGTLLLETMVQREEAADAYIDPEAEESLPGDMDGSSGSLLS